MSDAGVTLYVVLAVALAVWLGIFFYLWRLDALAHELRRRLDTEQERERPAAPRATLEKVKDEQ